MGWFAVDDGFDNHPKIRKAGNAAAGLFCRLGAYSSRSATEGVIPGPVARDYGTGAQLRKLGDLGMLHTVGHDCKDCVQPPPGDFVMHDYLDYNRSRREIENARKAGAERQRKRRERLAAEAAAAETATPGGVSGGVAPGVAGETSGGVAGEPPVFNTNRRSQAPVTADDAEERARTSPSQPHHPPLTEVDGTSQHDVPLIGDRPRIPDASQPLVDKLTAAGMVVGWDLAPADWFLIEALIKKCGDDYLVVTAAEMWAKAKKRPRYGSYFIPGWRGLPEIPAGTPLGPTAESLPAVVGPNVVAMPSPATLRKQQARAGYAALAEELPPTLPGSAG
jgi:hypothetical protein